MPKKTAESITILLSHGACVSIDASGYTADSLQAFAAMAKSRGGHVIMRNAGSKTVESLTVIASHGKAHVTLEIEE